MERIGEHLDKPVFLIPLENEAIRCEILTFGAAVRSLTVPDRNGAPVDVALGYDTLREYVGDTNCFGAIVGPAANRIGGASFDLNGTHCMMTKNDGENCLHSGVAGLHKRVWDVMELREDAVTLTCIHPDGLGGIPGDIRIAVTYSLRGRALCVEYWAVSDRDTILSLTNHTYFNLNGHAAGPITGHKVTLFSHSFTPVDGNLIPDGSIRAVVGSAMDLTHAAVLGSRIDAPAEQLQNAGGFDHNYLIDPNDEGLGFRPAALVRGETSGISMAVYTDRPCMQFYTGNHIPDGLPGKDGAIYNFRQGLCIETQGFPDAPHHPSFPPMTLKAGKVWQSRTEYRFS